MKGSSFPTLKLTLPTQKPGEHLLVDTRIESIAQHLKSQPYGNMAQTLPSIRRSIAGFNRTEVPMAARMNAMALYDRSYQLVADYYRPQSFQQDKRRDRVTREEKREFYLLTQEMAYGYKLLSIDMAAAKGPCHTLANILNLTLYYLSLVLMAHYDLYAPAPRNIWKEIHTILGYVLQFELIEKCLPQSAPQGCLETIEKTYLRITLVALINPYHLNQGQHWSIWRYLSHWVKIAELSEDPADFSSDQTFVVRMHSDARPVLQETPAGLEDEETLLLLTDKLVRQIDSQLSDLKHDGKPPLPGFGPEVNASRAQHLLDAMRYHWQMFKKRSSPRYTASKKISVIAGIRDIHHELLQNDPLTQADVEPQDIPKTSWRAVNTGASGICLNTGTAIRNIQVGQLIAVNDDDSTEDYQAWGFGVVRWLQTSRSHGITIGIEYLLGEVQSVSLKLLGVNERLEPGFLISGEDIQGRSAPTLIYAHGAIPPEQLVVLQIGDEHFAVMPTRRILDTLSIERVFYQTHELEEALSRAQSELNAAAENQKRIASGEEVIEMTALPGFGQTIPLQDNPLEKHQTRFDSIKVKKNRS